MLPPLFFGPSPLFTILASSACCQVVFFCFLLGSPSTLVVFFSVFFLLWFGYCFVIILVLAMLLFCLFHVCHYDGSSYIIWLEHVHLKPLLHITYRFCILMVFISFPFFLFVVVVFVRVSYGWQDLGTVEEENFALELMAWLARFAEVRQGGVGLRPGWEGFKFKKGYAN